MIFVFGSNEAGVHGAGAARYALLNKGAEMGRGFGPWRDSFAIPTKDWEIETLSLSAIKGYVEAFLRYARAMPRVNFQVTCIGCGLAGFNHEDIAPLFSEATGNCYFDELWRPYLGNSKNYWGTF